MKLSLDQFSKIKTLVVGDVMLDRYWFGNVDRISPEAPVPVLAVTSLVMIKRDKRLKRLLKVMVQPHC